MSAMPAANLHPLSPDFELPDATGRSQRLSSLWSKRPLALVVLPEFGTEMCADNATQLRDNQDGFETAGGAIAVIVTATPEEARAFAADFNLGYTVLCDASGAAITGLGVALDAFGKALPASFVIDTAGRITHEHRAASAYGYPPAWELVDEVSEITGSRVDRPEPPLDAISPPPSSRPSLVALKADVPAAVRAGSWSCARCGVHQCETNDISTASGFLSRMFNLQNRRFVGVSCLGCGYTELYKRNSPALMNILDFLSSS